MSPRAKDPGVNGTRPMRADAQRNRARIVSAARELFARTGRDTQMEDVAAAAGVGVGTVYRHFATKTALLTEMVTSRFTEMADMAREVESAHSGPDALFRAIRLQSEAVATDKGFQLAVMGWDALGWEEIEPAITALQEVTGRLIARAVERGLAPADLTPEDIGTLMCGATAVMYFKGDPAWRRHLDLVLAGLDVSAS